ncbi:MAG: hypothetical protein KDK78_04720 [Chlamydiia bacterium]|nr:hypothetical protein [Chlamydiia bacterium]
MRIPASWSKEAHDFFQHPEVRSIRHARKLDRELHYSTRKERIVRLHGRRFACLPSGRLGDPDFFRLHIQALVQDLLRCPEVTAIAHSTEPLTKDQRYFQKKVRALFFDKLSQLSPELFDRNVIVPGGSLLFQDGAEEAQSDLKYLLYPELKVYEESQKALDDQLHHLPEDLDADLRLELQLLRDTHKLDWLRHEALFAQQLGLPPRPAKGTGGTALLFGTEGLVGIRKLPRMRTLRKQWEAYFGQLKILSPDPLAQIQAEVFAYRVAFLSGLADFGVHVPPSELCLEKGKPVSLFMMSLYLHFRDVLARMGKRPGGEPEVRSQVFEGSDAPSHALIPEAGALAPSYTERELTCLQVFSIFDFYVFNLDRHRENWMLYCGQDKDSGHFDEIGLIDSANIMPCDHGARISIDTAHAHVLCQRKMAFAEAPLTDQARTYIRRLVSQQNRHIAMANNELEGYLRPSMLDLFRLRAQVLAKAVEDPTMSIYRLGKINTTVAMQHYL